MGRNPPLSYVLANALPASLLALMAYVRMLHLYQQAGTLDASHILLGVQILLALYVFAAFVFRRPPQSVSWHPWDVFSALLGTFAPSLFSLERAGDEKFAGLVLQVIGVTLSLFASISLGRSIGIIPANRGIKTQGLYRWIRHPMYASYQISNAGYILNHLSYINLLIFFLCLMSQLARIFAEERHLDKDVNYQAYKLKVRWRLLPFIF